MRTLGNFFWHIPFLGFVDAMLVALMGILWCCTIIGAPIGLGLLQYARFLLGPFTNQMVDKSVLEAEKTPNSLWDHFSMVVKICYYPFGFVLVVFQFFVMLGYAITIIGIPFAIILWKSLGVTLNPVNKVCAGNALLERINREKKVASYQV